MNMTFNTHLDGIYWIARNVEDEVQFERLREELLFNYIFTKNHFLTLTETIFSYLSGPIGTFNEN